MPETVPLYSWWSSGATDNLASSRPEWRPWMRPEGYRFSHTIGTVLAPSAPAPESTRRLHRWYSRERRDHVTSARFEPGTPPDPSYAYVGLEGHVYTRPLLGTTPLYSWFSHDRSDNFLTTRAEWVAEPGSVQHGYRCWGVEGYVFPVDRSHTPDPVAFTHHPGWSPTCTLATAASCAAACRCSPCWSISPTARCSSPRSTSSS